MALAASRAEAPLTAFVVSGQCRASWRLVHENDTAIATSRILTSYSSHVTEPFDVPAAVIFLLLKEPAPGACGQQLCERHFGAHACVHKTLPADSAECHQHPRDGKCFRRGVYASTPFWCTMGQAWAEVERYELSREQKFARVVFSRIDQLYSSAMGAWHTYRHEWHSAHAICHDFVRALG